MAVKFVAALAIAVAMTACSSSRQNAQMQSTTQQAASEQPSPAVNPSGNMLLYPGATRMGMQLRRPVKVCGTTATVSLYSVKDDPGTVANWYRQRIPDAIAMSMDSQVSTRYGGGTHSVIFTSDGSGSVAVVQLHFVSGRLAGLAQRMGADHTMVAIQNYDPPLPHDLIALLQRGVASGAAAASAARQQLKERCHGMFGHPSM